MNRFFQKVSSMITVLSTAFLLAVSPASAEMWVPNTLPDSVDSTPQWTIDFSSGGSADNAALVQDQYLEIDVPAAAYHSYRLLDSDAANAGAGFTGTDETVECTMRVISKDPATTENWVGSLLVYTDAGQNMTDFWFIRFDEGFLRYGWPRTSMGSYALDTSVFHTYTLQFNPQAQTGSLLVDGTVVAENFSPYTLGADISTGIRWGVNSNAAGGVTRWSSVAWGDDASINVPEPSTLMLLAISLLSIFAWKRKLA